MRFCYAAVLLLALASPTHAAAALSLPRFIRSRVPIAAVAAPAPTTASTTSALAVEEPPPKAAADEPRKATVSDWLTLWRLSKPDLPLIFVAFGMLLVAAFGEVLTPELQSNTLNLALNGGVRNLGPSITKLTVVGVLTAIATGIRGFVFWILGSRLVARLREALYASMLSKPQAFHDGRAPAELGSRLSSDVIKLGDVLSLNINIVLRQLVQTAGGMLFVYRLHPYLAGILLLGVLARSAFSAWYGSISREISDAQQDALATASEVALQGLTLVQTVRAYGTQRHESGRYGGEVRELLRLQNRQGAWYGLSRVVTGGLNAALLCSTLGLGAALVMRGALKVEALTALVLYTGFVSAASSDIGDQWARVQEALGSATKVFELVDVDSTLEQQKKSATAAAFEEAAPAPSTAASAEPRGELELRDVSFRYPSRDGAPVLDDVSLRIHPGEIVAIVGGSGSGKSTLLKLALNFYTPDAGELILDGRNVDSLPENELRSLVTWLPQQPPLFPVSIRENIAYGIAPDDIDQEAVEAAAKAANCHEFITRLPMGYDTPMGSSGGSLSGGQRQRVAIARALLRDPAVLMLDEPTSALDPTSAELVEEALRRASATRSVVLITHKIAQAAMCDRVIVLDHGRVVEEGTHAQLVSKGGKYAEMLVQGTGGSSPPSAE